MHLDEMLRKDFLEPQWQPIAKLPASVPENSREWLTAEVSLTTRLQQLGSFTVQVQQEKWGNALHSESELLDIAQDSKIWQRDVILCVNEKPYVIAHSIIPETTLHAIPELKHLGNTSLGDLIFKTLQGERQSLEFACIYPGDKWAKLSESFHAPLPLWARRSLLVACGQKLLVNEIFL